MAERVEATTLQSGRSKSALRLAWAYECPHQPCKQHEARELALRWIDTEGARMSREWAEMYCTLRRAEKRIQKQRRIITRLIAERREAKRRG